MLSDVKIKALKPKVKLYAITDEKGLSLEVSPIGGDSNTILMEKQKRLSVGTYPDVSVKQAREQRDELRKQIANGVDASDTRKVEKLSHVGQLSFEYVVTVET